MKLNDGKGLYDNEGLIDTLIADLNSLQKLLMTGQYIQYCAMITGMAQKLVNLKEGIRSDMDSMKEKVEDLKRINDRLIAEKDGAENGSN